MPRPKKDRLVSAPPLFSSFKPTGVQRRILTQITVTLDEYEAIRLADYKNMDHIDASAAMGISRPTFTRLLESAHHKLAEFLLEGKEIIIEGGNVHFKANLFVCLDCGHKFKKELGETPVGCPECGSGDLEDIAGGFGHGRCCEAFIEKNNQV